MYFPGHVATSYLTSSYLKTDASVAIVAGIFPDAADKFAYYVLAVTPEPRVPTHTLLGLFSLAMVAFIIGKRFGRPWLFAYSWLLGHGLHLAADLLNGAVAFFWPFVSYDFLVHAHESVPENWAQPDWRQVLITVAVETALTVWAVVLWRRRHRVPGGQLATVEANSNRG